MAIRETVYPRQVILVTSRAEVKSRFSTKHEKKDNIMTLSWHTPLSFNPELYAIIIGKSRFSYQLVFAGVPDLAFSVWKKRGYHSPDLPIVCRRK